MAQFCLILAVVFLTRLTTVLNTPISATFGPTQIADITALVSEAGDDFDLTTPRSAILTAVSEDDSDDDDGGESVEDTTTLQTTTTTPTSEDVVSGIVVDEDIDESKVVILKANLEQFGYVPLGSTFGEANINYTSAILEYQQHGGINQTGILDAETAELLDTPRCGVPDILPYVTGGIAWPRNVAVTYSFGTLTNDLNQNAIKNELRRAFQVWDDVSGLTFREVVDSSSVDIRIKFGSYEHGDGISFDGQGGVLAHAFLPRNGDAHFDDSETWTIGTNFGTNLFQVAAHEFGHSLGLYHSDVQAALMYPYYRGYNPNFNLDRDDIAGITSLYGRNTGTTTTTRRPTITRTTTRRTTTRRTTTRRTTTQPTTTQTTTIRPPTSPTPPRQACTGSFDAVIKDYSGRIYALAGRYYWRLDQASPSWGVVRNRFGFDLPENVDASFQNGIFSYFFSECYYYYQTSTQRRFSRIPINRRWVGLPCDIDAAYKSSDTGPTFFFKGGFVYKFSSTNRLQRRTRISTFFRNTPYALRDGVEAVVRVDDVYLHFYRDGRYYRMRDSTKQFVNFPNGLSYRNVIDTLIPQCRSLNLSVEIESCSNSSE
ncbi:50 kDa hatching enzyme-like [Strongylocentrotus purpuratus]|uniref:Peptidase metallopeptidase domain-containing protein n=1 Tax=Strongylocentrotus purpuratus TaxID=7668 RepID=A0A7M7NQ34_STRPU|nr:50 kDa hatching enzyme-like [Strongylocentrotus purpuratus]